MTVVDVLASQPAGDPYPFLAHTSEILVGLVAVSLLVYLLYRYGWPLLVSSHDDTVSQLRTGMARAESEIAEAQEQLERSRARLSGVDDEAARVRDDARADAGRIKEELAQRAGDEARRITAQGRQTVDASRDRTVSDLRGELGGGSVELARRIVEASLSDDTRRSQSVDRFLDQLEGMAGSAARSGNGTGPGPAEGGRS